MRILVGAGILGLLAACTAFGAETANAPTADGGAAPDGSSDGGVGDSATGTCGHTFCATFDTLSSSEWSSSTTSPDSTKVSLTYVPDAAHRGKGGLRVSVPATSSTIYSHLDESFTGRTSATSIRLAYFINFKTLNASSAEIEISDIVHSTGPNDYGSQVIVTYSNGKIHLLHEENSTGKDNTQDVSLLPGWHQVVVTVTGLPATPKMQLSVDGAPAPEVSLTEARPFKGDFTLQLGTTWVSPNLGTPVVYDIDDVTLDVD